MALPPTLGTARFKRLRITTQKQSVNQQTEIFIVATVFRMASKSRLEHYNYCAISELNILKRIRIDVVWRQPR